MNKAILRLFQFGFFCTFPKPDSPEGAGTSPAWQQTPLHGHPTTGLSRPQDGRVPSGLICPLGPGPSETQDVSVCTQGKIQEDLHHMANSI